MVNQVGTIRMQVFNVTICFLEGIVGSCLKHKQCLTHVIDMYHVHTYIVQTIDVENF